LGNESNQKNKKEYLFTSVTEYDIDCPKNFDIVFSGAKQFMLKGYDGEKIRLVLQSNNIVNIQKIFKTKLDDVKNRIDVDINHNENMTQAKAKESLDISILLPLGYIKKIEVSGNTEYLIIENIIAENLESSGKISFVNIDGMPEHIELNSDEDLEIYCKKLNGRLDINQLSATSKLTIPADTVFVSKIRGIANHIFYQRDNKETADFSVCIDSNKTIGNMIELNGIKSELIINSVSDMRTQK